MTTPPSTDRRPRRRRHQRYPPEEPSSPTPKQLSLLQMVGEHRIMSLPQLAAMDNRSEQSARRGMRGLYDHGLVERIAVPRVALAAPDAANDPALVFGSAPAVYCLTKAGLKVLERAGLACGIQLVPQRYGPRNFSFLAHELGVRDAAVWFTLAARRYPGHQVEMWRYEEAAQIDLRRSRPPKVLRPDALVRYRLGERSLLAFIEWDRATERAGHRWEEKMTAYRVLFEGGLLKQVLGTTRARVLTFVPGAARRDWLAAFIVDYAPSWLAARFWLADPSTLSTPDVYHAGWRRASEPALQPLLLPDQQQEGDDGQRYPTSQTDTRPLKRRTCVAS